MPKTVNGPHPFGGRRRAFSAWVAAAKADITYLDIYRRLATAYRDAGLLDELAELTDARIDAGADTPTLVGLLLEKAGQRRERGDVAGVIEALAECLELDPSHFAALRELVETHRRREDWQGAAEALIRIARLKRSVNEQVWAFSQLAEIYHEHLADLPRAEASLRRALALAPAHIDTIDRLASVLTEQDKPRDAARLLEDLVRHAPSDAERRDYRIRLAATVELAGESRRAEAMLEELRSEQPTDPDVILAIADYYGRQGAGPAESMHLNRAANDLRDAIEAEPGDELSWTTLVRVLDRRHGPGAASCAASAAIAIGHPPSLFEGDVTAQNQALGEPKVPLAPAVDNVVAPRSLPQALRRLFTLCEHAFDKMLPFDASAWRLRRPATPHRTLVEEAGAVAEALGISEPKLRITYLAPASCMPISGDPPTLVVGGNLHEATTPEERIFLFARALKVAANHLAPALRARPEELDAALLALLQGHDPSRQSGVEAQQLQDLRKKLMRAVPRRWRDEVESLVLELRGNSDFSTRLVPFAVSTLGDRVALTLTGDLPSAVDALLKISGHETQTGRAGRLAAIRETPEAWALLRFAISDAHFEARAQAGVDR
jgi:tetratricopeptide (TPR) repeat protein